MNRGNSGQSAAEPPASRAAVVTNEPAPRAGRFRGLAATAGWIVLLAAVNAGFYWRHWSGQETFPYDFCDGYYAGTAYWIASVEAGEWPHWMPYQSMGFPFAMNVQSGMGYPPLWGFPLVKMQYTLHAATAMQALHVFLGGLGMFFLVRACWRQSWPAGLAAVAFELFGGFFSNAQHPDIIRAFALMPWLFWAAWLDNGPGRQLVFFGRRWTSRLPARSLWLPPLVALYITGAYAGNMIAGMLMLGVFLLVQTVLLLVRRPALVALNDLSVQGILIGLGVALAAAFLLPSLGLFAEFVRSGDLANIDRWRLDAASLPYLIYPCSVGFAGRSAAATDCSMLGMQLPVVLLPFLLLARWKDLWRLLPLLVVAAAAAVLSFDEFAPLARQAWRLFPPLELSRFPAGDFRLFIYLAALMACISGARRALEHRGELPLGLFARLAVGAALPVLGGLLLMRSAAAAEDQPRLIAVLCWQSVGLIALLLAVWLAPVPRRAAALGLVLPALCAAMLWPIAEDMQRFWRVPLATVEQWYRGGGVPLVVDGRLNVTEIFRRGEEGPRPARLFVANPQQFGWQGYVNGRYMLGDRSGCTSRRRQMVENDPGLMEYMRRGSELRALEIGPSAEADLPLPPAADASSPLTDWQVERYGRNEAVYRLNLSRPAVVVENELYFPGWRGFLEKGDKGDEGAEEIRPLQVAGALRGWALPAGAHRLRLTYRTPLLTAGAIVSVGAFLLYAATVVLVYHAARQKPLETEAIPTTTALSGRGQGKG
jgi:hypothetical protein